MKHFLIGILTLWCGTVSAQITLLPTDYPATLTGTDSLKITTAASALPPCITGPGITWDFSSVSDSTIDLFAYRVADSAYAFADSTTTNKLIYFPYIANYHDSLLSSGLYQYGFKVKDTNFALFSYTGSSYDSFFIAGQQCNFTGKEAVLRFPVAMGSTWSSTYMQDVNFQLTYTIGTTYSHQPGYIRSYFTRKDTVTGWGIARVKDAAGGPSLYWNVLQVQSVITKMDSFFLNGGLMPGTLLTTFLLVQGQKSKICKQSYYRTAELTPLVTVKFKDSTFTTPVNATYHRQRLQRLDQPIGITLDKDAVLYPNPVSQSGTLNFYWPGVETEMPYFLFDVRGNIVAAQTAILDDHKAEIKLPGNLPTGNYYFRLAMPGNKTLFKSVEISD